MLFFNNSIEQSGADFVTINAASYAAGGVTVTYNSSSNELIFRSIVAGQDFTGNTTAVTMAGDFAGSVTEEAIANRTALAEIDTITLTGSSGTATIVCAGISRTITYSGTTGIEHTASWHTRGGSEAQPLIEIVADEVADMYSRGRHFIQMSLYELTESLDITKNLQDPLNKVGANNRVFAFNRGSLDCQKREWTADYIEIGNK